MYLNVFYCFLLCRTYNPTHIQRDRQIYRFIHCSLQSEYRMANKCWKMHFLLFFPHNFILLLKNMHLSSFNTGAEKFSSKLKMILMINCAWKCSSQVFFLLLPYSSTYISRGPDWGLFFLFISDTSWIIMPFVLEVIIS